MPNPFRVTEDPNDPVPPEVNGWRIYAISAAAACVSSIAPDFQVIPSTDTADLGGA